MIVAFHSFMTRLSKTSFVEVWTTRPLLLSDMGSNSLASGSQFFRPRTAIALHQTPKKYDTSGKRLWLNANQASLRCIRCWQCLVKLLIMELEAVAINCMSQAVNRGDKWHCPWDKWYWSCQSCVRKEEEAQKEERQAEYHSRSVWT